MLPGPTLTARRHHMLEHFAAARSVDIQEAAEVFAAEARILRFGTVEEVAEGYAWLLSPHARWVHGTALRVDGGEAKPPNPNTKTLSKTRETWPTRTEIWRLRRLPIMIASYAETER